MKFVFLKSGDYLEFKSKNTTFINKWFEFLFENNINSKYQSINPQWSTNLIEERLTAINEHIIKVNHFLKLHNCLLFTNNYTLDQEWLNLTHKIWVLLTNRQKNEIYDMPPEMRISWDEINRLIHFIEQHYSNEFYNSALPQVPASLGLKITAEDCEYTQQDLILSYNNLGRHQYNQWEVGSNVDDETNNYKTLSTSIIYSYSYQSAAMKRYEPAPIDYVSWCKKNKLEVLPPWVVLGRFELSKYTVREIMHRNLKNDASVGFEL